MLKPAQKLLLIFFLLNLLLAAELFLLKKVMVEPINGSSRQIYDEQTELAAVRQQKSSIINLQQVFLEEFSEANLLSDSAFGREETVKFVQSLESIADRYQVKQTLTFRQPPKAKSKKSSQNKDENEAKTINNNDKINAAVDNKVYFELTLTGEFANLMNFIFAYENLNSYPKLEVFQINNQTEKQPDGSLKILPTLRANLIGQADYH